MTEEPDLFTQRHTHRNPLYGEKLAARKARRSAESTRSAIQVHLEMRGPQGMTPDEFSQQTGGLINTVRRRFTDLWKDGIIRHHAEKLHRPNLAGNPCVVWVLGRDQNLKLSRVAQLQLRISELEEENCRLKNLVDETRSNGG
jgi:hypothetical protein